MPMNRSNKQDAPRPRAHCRQPLILRARAARPISTSETTVQQAKILVADPAYPDGRVLESIATLMSSQIRPSS